MTDERKVGAPGKDGRPGQVDATEEVAKEAEHLLFRDMAQYMSQFARWELVVYPSDAGLYHPGGLRVLPDLQADQ